MPSNVTRPTEISIALAWAVVTVASGAFYCSIAPSPDQSMYDYIAWQGLHGIQWYVGSFDVTWPGSLLIHETGIRIFGVHRWTARLTDFILLQPAIVAMYFFLRASNLTAAGLALAFAYPIIYVTSGGWMAGHRDIVAMHFLIGAAAIVLTLRSNRRLALFLAGSLIGYAVMLRPTYLAFWPATLLAWYVESERVTARQAAAAIALSVLGVSVVPAAFGTAGLVTHTFDAWLFDSVGFVLLVYQDSTSRIHMISPLLKGMRVHFWWLALAGTPAFAAWFLAGRMRTRAILLACLALTAVVSFVVQNKGYAYHLGGLIPVFAISAFGGTNLLWSMRDRGRFYRCAAVAVGLILCVGVASRIQKIILPSARNAETAESMREGEVSEIVGIIDAESSAESRFYQWGWNYDVAFRSERLAATRYIGSPLLSAIKSENGEFGSWLKLFDRDLEVNRPSFILLDIAEVERKSPALEILLAHLKQDYVIRLNMKDMVLYKYNQR